MRFSTLFFIFASLCTTASAQFVTPDAVDSAALDAVRGGFGYGDSLLVTLGIERLVQVNGNIVDHSLVQLGDVSKLSSGQTKLAGNALETRLIQNGQLAQFPGGLSAGALGGTIIQNSLNDQIINNQTTIHASVNNAGMLQTMNFNASLNQALNNAVSSK